MAKKETNPLVNEGILKSLLKPKTKDYSVTSDFAGSQSVLTSDLVGMNNGIPICAEACACCWDKPIPETYDGKCEYIAKRSKTGHTSILEHSNFVIYLGVGKNYTEDLMEVLTACNYLRKKVFPSNDGTKWHVILGGSYRGYSDIYREITNFDNRVLSHISNLLYTYANSSPFEDICELGLLDKDRFANMEPDEHFKLLDLSNDNAIFSNDLFDIINIDSIKKLDMNLIKIDKELSLPIVELLQFATVTVLFKNMSRTCTHQLVRHRNAITQESQRYVDYSSACFASPEQFKPDKYDSEFKYPIHFGPSPQLRMTLSEIGKAMCGIYNTLINKAAVGANHVLMKEDARAFLPGNVQCRKIYVTFTYKSLNKFLILREHPAAQAEIRMYARSLGEKFRDFSGLGDDIEYFDQPKIAILGEALVDEDEGIVEEVLDVSEDAYIRASGLDKEESADEAEVNE